MRYAQLLFAAFVLSASLHAANASATESTPVVPPAGVEAEAAGQWDAAVAIYKTALAGDASRADLWIRVANIEGRRNNLPATIAALQSAAEARPGDATVFRRLSQAYAKSNQPLAATEAIDGALALEPNNHEYLRAAGVLATWNSDYTRAKHYYERLQRLEPADEYVALNLARVSAWSGDADQAVGAYRRYLRMHADAGDVWLELARTESWRGNYSESVDVLRTYAGHFGESPAYVRELASVLAAAGRPTRAVDAIDPLLKNDPNDFDANVTRTIALTKQFRPREAFDALDSLRRLNPGAKDTQTASRVVRSTLGSTVDPGFNFYSDSDQLRILRFAPSARVRLASGTELTGGYERADLDAPNRSGLGRMDGGTSHYESIWAGVSQSFHRVTVGARAASATADGHERNPYALSAELRASDTLTLSAERSDDFFVISPRTVELGLTDLRHRGQVDWAPTLNLTFSAQASVHQISDGNVRWDAIVTPRRAVVRSDSLNLDLGASAYMLGTSEDLPNGYYDPHRYENYSLVAFPYFKISENVGLGMTLAGGIQRDRSASPFTFGGNATAEATFGIYRAWVLKISASATNNRRTESGAFQGYGGGVVLTRRF